MNSKRMICAAVGLITVASLVVGCGTNNNTPGGSNNPPTQTITIAGSTSVQPVSDKLVEVYNNTVDGDQRIDVQGGGSGAGIKAAQTGAADIGMSSRELKADEKTVTELVIAKDGIAVIAHPSNPINDLTPEQIQQIFAGEITDWKEVGGEAAKINVVIREAGSGTRGAFEEMVMGKVECTQNATVQNGTGGVMTTVAGDKNAIGYASIAALNDTVQPVVVNGVEPTDTNILNGSYKIARPFIYMTKEQPEGAGKKFMDWVMSPEGQTVVQSAGLIPVAPTK